MLRPPGSDLQRFGPLANESYIWLSYRKCFHDSPPGILPDSTITYTYGTGFLYLDPVALRGTSRWLSARLADMPSLQAAGSYRTRRCCWSHVGV